MLTTEWLLETPTRRDDSFLLQPDEGSPLATTGGQGFIKVRGEDSAGAFALLEQVIPPVTSGPPLHINTREDEVFYILEGTLRLQLGERLLDAGPGTMCYIPRGSVHTFCNPYDTPVRLLGYITPAGFEHYFEE